MRLYTFDTYRAGKISAYVILGIICINEIYHNSEREREYALNKFTRKIRRRDSLEWSVLSLSEPQPPEKGIAQQLSRRR